MFKPMAAIVAAFLLTLALAHPAQARHRHNHHRIAQSRTAVAEFCGDRYCSIAAEKSKTRIYIVAVKTKRTTRRYFENAYGDNEGIVSHPAGCPRVAFCGCGASVEIFGHPIRSLYLAANWFRFPRVSPSPGMAAVRQHHVFVIRAVNGDGTVLAYDANSGGHLTRVHTVSLRGYSVRDPHGNKVAMR